jgi:chromosome segregation ATPase
MDMRQELENLQKEIRSLKSEKNDVFHSQDFGILSSFLEDMKKTIYQLKDDVSDIKKEILNPEDGIIVRLNQMSEKLKMLETEKISKMEKEIEECKKVTNNMMNFSGFKENVVKFLWIALGAVITVIIKLTVG